jgi:hypothetical protein
MRQIKYIKQPLATTLPQYTDAELRKIESSTLSLVDSVDQLSENDVRRDGAALDWNGSTGTDDHDAIAKRVAIVAVNGGTVSIVRSTATGSTINVPN